MYRIYAPLFPHKYNSETKVIIQPFFKVRKNGQMGTRVYLRLVYITPLNKCDLCGRISTPRNINYKTVTRYYSRQDEKDDVLSKYDSLYYLCTSCWNKCERIGFKEKEHDELRRLINKLKKEITYAKRNTTYEQ